MNQVTEQQSSDNRKRVRLKLPLFWKILIWFWLSIILIVTVNLFIGFVNSNKVHVEPLPPPTEEEFRFVMQKAAKVLERLPLRRMPRKHLNEYFFLDRQGNDYFERQLPELLKELHQQVLKQQHPLIGWRNQEAYWGGHKVESDGNAFWIYSRQRPPRISRFMLAGFFQDFAKSLVVIVFLISFPLSFLLSWLITSPIKRLQKAARSLQNNLNDISDLEPLLNRRDEFAELANDVKQLANHLEMTISAQKQLISDVSHELRSPLTRLKIAIGIAEKQHQQTQVINFDRLMLEANRMNDMLERLLALSRLESPHAHFEFKSTDLSALLQTILDDGQFECEQAAIKIEASIQPNVKMLANAETLYSALENILRNAIRYSPHGGTIRCLLFSDSKSIYIQIIDQGPGIEETQLNLIFDPFYRPEVDRARESGGVGLGLAIAQRAVVLNRGNIRANNNLSGGLTVEVCFTI